MSEMPILVLLAPATGLLDAANIARGREGDPVVLGLGLTRRAVLAAGRSGYGHVFLLASNGVTAPWMPVVADWRNLAARSPSFETARVVIAPAAILAETDWLQRLAATRIEAAAWAAARNRIVVLPSGLGPDLVDLLEGAEDLSAVEGRLASHLGPAERIAVDINPLVIETPADVPVAERRLMRSLVKDTDGFMARHVERPISLMISRRLAGTAVTPNQMSLISIAVGLCGAPFFLSARPLLQTVGALLFLAHSILDGCDGELARLKFQQSRWGGILDFWGDNVVHVAIFACMGVGWSLAERALWPLWLGAAAVLGTLGSAGFVYWRLMRVKDGGDTLFTSVSDAPERPLTRLLDSASRRDFIYLVILLALFGRSSWFVALAGIGAPVYFFLVLLAARPGGVAKRADESDTSLASGVNRLTTAPE
jgi:phosphatidylglycerophosphate synthase